LKLDALVFPGSLKNFPDTARYLEELGFDTLWTLETRHNPFFPLILSAEHTRTMKLGTSIAVAFPRSPMVLAHIAWDLQEFSGGRFILGLGTQVRGHIERRFSVPWNSPGPRLREIILALRAIWDCWQNEAPLKFQGKFYSFTLMTPFFNPGPIRHPEIPIFVGGLNPYMCRLAGELCQGMHIHPLHTVKFIHEAIVPGIKEGAGKAGRDYREVSLSAAAFVATGRDKEAVEKAKEKVRSQIAFYSSTRNYFPVLEMHGWGDTARALQKKSIAGDWEGMPGEISDGMLDEFAIIGAYPELAEKIRKKYDGVIDRLSLYDCLPGPGEEKEWRPIIDTING